MRVTCTQAELSRGLGIVGRAVAARSPLPITANVLIASDGGRLKLSATNLEITMSCWIDATIEEEGAIVLDSEGARAGDDDADVTLTASAETFRGMMEGNVNPTMAFMSGQLKIDGDMSLAMKLAAVLS